DMIAGAGQLERRIAEHAHWRLAEAVVDGRQSPTDPDADRPHRARRWSPTLRAGRTWQPVERPGRSPEAPGRRVVAGHARSRHIVAPTASALVANPVSAGWSQDPARRTIVRMA